MNDFKAGDLVLCVCGSVSCRNILLKIERFNLDGDGVHCRSNDENFGIFMLNTLINVKNITKLEKVIYGLSIN